MRGDKRAELLAAAITRSLIDAPREAADILQGEHCRQAFGRNVGIARAISERNQPHYPRPLLALSEHDVPPMRCRAKRPRNETPPHHQGDPVGDGAVYTNLLVESAQRIQVTLDLDHRKDITGYSEVVRSHVTAPTLDLLEYEGVLREPNNVPLERERRSDLRVG